MAYQRSAYTFSTRRSQHSRRRSDNLYTPSCVFSEQSLDKSQFRFSLFVRFVNGGDLGSSVFALHATTGADLELRFKLLQCTAKTLLFLSRYSLLGQKFLSGRVKQ